ncbi:MAG: DUF4256 domain-containing protein [Lentimicrobium sp.]|nr:DUF4256 domain-containing protein [Lentimicrobium sp.]
MTNQKELTSAMRDELLEKLKARFGNHMHRHMGVDWSQLQAKLFSNPQKLWSLYEMERTGGEPDVVVSDTWTGEFVFYDCSSESPVGRRSLCYDRQGLDSRKEHKPEGNAVDMAATMGIELLNEEQYMTLQTVGRFDTKTSGWLKTPDAVRKAGGALFADFRYGRVFVYHNSAPSYYASRGFRGLLRV